MVAELKRGGVPTLVYTVNDHGTGSLAEHLAAIGVAGLFTDDPLGMSQSFPNAAGRGSNAGDGDLRFGDQTAKLPDGLRRAPVAVVRVWPSVVARQGARSIAQVLVQSLDLLDRGPEPFGRLAADCAAAEFEKVVAQAGGIGLNCEPVLVFRRLPRSAARNSSSQATA